MHDSTNSFGNSVSFLSEHPNVYVDGKYLYTAKDTINTTYLVYKFIYDVTDDETKL